MTGILVVSFGTTYSDTRSKNIDKIAGEVENKYKGIPVYQAYSSQIVRKVLLERDNFPVDDIEGALRRMKADQITSVKILPTHIIDGIENTRLCEAVKNCQSWFETIQIARPLLGQDSDYVQTAQALLRELSSTAGEDAIVFMGHGSTHKADESYLKFAQILQREKKNTYLATVEGSIRLEDVLPQIRQENKKGSRIVITPFMLVAGDHANNDMAGEEANSFASRIKEAGYQPQCLLRGIGEYSSIRRLYLQHLADIC